jgi:hypothetical protein
MVSKARDYSASKEVRTFRRNTRYPNQPDSGRAGRSQKQVGEIMDYEMLNDKDVRFEQYGPDEFMYVVHSCDKFHRFAIPVIKTIMNDQIYAVNGPIVCPICGSKKITLVLEPIEEEAI